MVAESSNSFFIYDFEAADINPRRCGVTQFAGQRVNDQFEPIEEPVNLIGCPPDDFPMLPAAAMVHGIGPIKALTEGVNEHELAQRVFAELERPNTVSMAYNGTKFDEELVRFLAWRNFHPSYDFEWRNGCSRFDPLPMFRFGRAVSPRFLPKWADDDEGKPTARLEKLATANGILMKAHDALEDVKATVELLKLGSAGNRKFFDHCFTRRDKRTARADLTSGNVLIISSTKAGSDNMSIMPVVYIGDSPDSTNEIVMWNLRFPMPEDIASFTEDDWKLFWYPADRAEPRAIKVKVNKPPCYMQASSLTKMPELSESLKLDYQELVTKAGAIKSSALLPTIVQHAKATFESDFALPDELLYNGFISNSDQRLLSKASSHPSQWKGWRPVFDDQRLRDLVPLYVCRYSVESALPHERDVWAEHLQEVWFARPFKHTLADGTVTEYPAIQLVEMFINDPSSPADLVAEYIQYRHYINGLFEFVGQ